MTHVGCSKLDRVIDIGELAVTVTQVLVGRETLQQQLRWLFEYQGVSKNSYMRSSYPRHEEAGKTSGSCARPRSGEQHATSQGGLQH